MRICRNGHEAAAKKKCLRCRSLAQGRYGLTKKGRASALRYRRTPKGLARARAHSRRHYLATATLAKARVLRNYYANRAVRCAQMKAYREKFGANESTRFWLTQERNAA